MNSDSCRDIVAFAQGKKASDFGFLLGVSRDESVPIGMVEGLHFPQSTQHLIQRLLCLFPVLFSHHSFLTNLGFEVSDPLSEELLDTFVLLLLDVSHVDLEGSPCTAHFPLSPAP